MEKHTSTENSCIAHVVIGSALVAVMVAMTGCATITGIEKMDLWGAKFEFTRGTDFHVGANTIDHVDDRRGVNVEKGRK